MDKFRIEDQFDNNLKRDKQLTNAERKAFENELDEINRLIEENLIDETESTETRPVQQVASPEKKDNIKNTIADNEAKIGQDEWQRRQLERRINLNRDQTGRHKKAAGEDI